MGIRKIWFLFGVIILLSVGFLFYYLYLNHAYFFSNGAIDADRVASLAIEKKDPSLCGKIKMVGIQFDVSEEQLRNECYGKVAREMRDQKICDAIQSPYSRDTCYLEFAQMLNIFTACDSIINESQKGFCYGFFTAQGKPIETKSTSTVCETIQSDEGKDLCYFGIAKNISNASLCEKMIKGISYKNQCYSMVGSQNSDLSLCAKITADNQADKASCYSAIALQKNDPSICEKITDEWWKSPCYFDIAFRYKDYALCEKITVESVRNQCLSYKKSRP